MLAGARLPVSAPPCRLWRGTEQSVGTLRVESESASTRKQTNLSESHDDGLWEAWEGLGLRVVLQEDAVALENHVRLAVDDQRALVRLEAHRVAQLPTVGRHLGGSEQKPSIGKSESGDATVQLSPSSITVFESWQRRLDVVL